MSISNPNSINTGLSCSNESDDWNDEFDAGHGFEYIDFSEERTVDEFDSGKIPMLFWQNRTTLSINNIQNGSELATFLSMQTESEQLENIQLIGSRRLCEIIRNSYELVMVLKKMAIAPLIKFADILKQQHFPIPEIIHNSDELGSIVEIIPYELRWPIISDYFTPKNLREVIVSNDDLVKILPLIPSTSWKSMFQYLNCGYENNSHLSRKEQEEIIQKNISEILPSQREEVLANIRKKEFEAKNYLCEELIDCDAALVNILNILPENQWLALFQAFEEKHIREIIKPDALLFKEVVDYILQKLSTESKKEKFRQLLQEEPLFSIITKNDLVDIALLSIEQISSEALFMQAKFCLNIIINKVASAIIQNHGQVPDSLRSALTTPISSAVSGLTMFREELARAPNNTRPAGKDEQPTPESKKI